MTDIDDLIATPTPLALLPIELQRSLINYTLDAFGEWRNLYEKYGPDSRSGAKATALGKYDAMAHTMCDLISRQSNVYRDLVELWDALTTRLGRWSQESLVEELRRKWAGEASS